MPKDRRRHRRSGLLSGILRALTSKELCKAFAQLFGSAPGALYPLQFLGQGFRVEGRVFRPPWRLAALLSSLSIFR